MSAMRGLKTLFLLVGLGGWSTAFPGIAFSTPANLPGHGAISPGQTNVPIFRLVATQNNDAATGIFPYIYHINFLKTGALPAGAFRQLRVYYDFDGAWMSGDEREMTTAQICHSGTNALFDQNYSPNNFGFDGFSYVGPNLNLYLGTGQTIYLYLVADFSTTLPDLTGFGVTINTWNIFFRYGVDYSGNTGAALVQGYDTPLLTRVAGTRLAATGTPIVASKNVAFDVTVRALDAYGNQDTRYTNGIYFVLTNLSPTVYSAGMASVLHGAGNPITLSGGSNTFAGECTISNAGLYQLLVMSTNGDLLAGASSNILVEPELHHFDIVDQSGRDINKRVFVAGLPLSQQGVTNLRVVSRNYSGGPYTNYQGLVYFGTDDPLRGYSIPYDNNPATAPTTGTPDKHAFTLGQSSISLSGDQILFTHAGAFNFFVYDDALGVKSDIPIIVSAAAPARLQARMKASFGVNEAIQFKLQAYDAWDNPVDWFNGDLGVTLNDRNTGAPFFDFSLPAAMKIAWGQCDAGSNGPMVRQPGAFDLTLSLSTNAAVKYTLPIAITLSFDQNQALAIANNYIRQGSAPYAEILGRNEGAETDTVTVTIYDSYGRKVREYPRLALYPGVQVLARWDLRDSRQLPVASGRYQVLMTGKAIKPSLSMIFIVQ